MDDIVERLRFLAAELEADDSHEQLDPGAVLCKEAADEIERLRSDGSLLAMARNLSEMREEIERLRAECEALRKDAELIAGKTALRCIEMAMWPQGLDDEQSYYGRMFAEFIKNEFKRAIDRAMASNTEGGRER